MARAPRTIPCTHTGSLPRPDDLIQIMWAVGDGIPVDKVALEERVNSAIDEIVRKQVAAGVTIINDGEMSKPELRAAATRAGHDEIFTSAASPGVVSLFFGNDYYGTHEEYVFAIAEAMRFEYEAIAAAGATVQVDCPDLAMGRHSAYANMSLEEFRATIRTNIEALNHAVRNIPAEQLRMHLCWGNYPGPHHHDVPIQDIIDIVWTAKPQTVLFEGANPRHSHEWRVMKELGVPKEKFICPGVIEPQSNYIEHPELVAQRLERWAEVVEPDRLLAGVDCGFSVHVGTTTIDPDVAFAKLAALSQGSELAAKRLFK